MCWCFLINMKYINICCLLLFYLQSRQIGCSEFPERECCDPIYPLIPDPEPLPPALPTTTISSSSVNPTGRSGPNIKTAIAILNCILARQLCFEDPSCSAILEIIPRVCGPVPVACSTVTVTKCQAALRTLQAFPFFRPTCLCKEPGIDPDCNYFRDFLFDHPCGFVLKKEKDPYPVDALPTCNHALSVCQQERKCIKLFEDFKTHCKVRDNKCRMEDRDSCHEAWTNLRLSPMFGCICPNNHMKRRCDKIFSVVNHNPCVDVFFSALDSSSGTATNSVNTNYFPPESDVEPTAPRKVFPYKYPYFLYPPSHKIPLALASHRPATSDYNSHYHYPSTINAHDSYNISAPYDNLDDSQSTYSKHFNRKNNSLHNNKLQHQHQIIIDNINKNQENINNNNDNNNNDYLHNLHQFRANRTSSTSDVVRMHKNQQDYVKHRLEIVRAMGMDDNYHRLLDENMALVDTPLIAPSNSYFPQHYKTALYPYNISSYHGNYIYSSNGIYTPPDPDYERVINNSDPYSVDKTENGGDDEIDPETHPIHFQSTCHIALDSCREDAVCASSLQNILINCDYHKCNRNSCMEALQGFYRNSHEDLSLDAALCLCRKTPNRHDSCMLAKEKLHPICAQRPPENINSQTTSNGIVFNPPPACHQVADLCREDPECRSRLELYEQSCAVDSVTKKCAGKASSCRIALLGILGTPLRTTCACQGSDLQQLYECLGWQRLLWLNPCVVESQKDFHLKRLAELGLLMTTPSTTTHRITRPPTTTTTTTTTTVATTTTTVRYIHVHREHPREPVIKQPAEYYHPTEQQITESNYIDREDPFPILLPNAESNNQNNRDANELPEDLFEVITTEPYDIETTTIPPTTTTVETTTIPIRYCVVQKPHQPDQYIAEGKSRRLYGMDDAECSELCSCSDETLVIACHALCVPLAPCRTSLAYYSHSAPAYQAFRGRCVCYSGRFICMRPPPGEYSLPGGIFLLLGYSSTDEALLRPHTNLGVQDAVRALQQYVTQHINNQTLCSLTLFNISDENIILSVRLPHDQKLNTIELLRKEKDQCTSILETISHQINTQYLELSAHRLLSIFKMAEVQIIWPEINNAISTKRKRMTSLCIISSIIFSFLFSNNINFIHQHNT